MTTSNGIKGLGHVGLYVNDLQVMRSFYEDVIGLTVSDVNPKSGAVFMTSDRDREHHELLLVAGRSMADGARLIQQLSWRAEGVEELQAAYQRLVKAGADIDSVVTHGNALSVYFRDPEGNSLEVYVPTGLDVPQPFRAAISLEGSPAEILEESAQRVKERGVVV